MRYALAWRSVVATFLIRPIATLNWLHRATLIGLLYDDTSGLALDWMLEALEVSQEDEEGRGLFLDETMILGDSRVVYLCVSFA